MPRRLIATLLVPVAIIAVGTAGYMFIEGWPLTDALYMTVMTVTTVGYGEVHHLDTKGRYFTIALMLGGIFTLFYAAGEVIRAIVTGQVQLVLGGRGMEQALAGMKDHVIVCGYGRMGRLVCREFSAQRTPFIVIDRKEELLEGFKVAHGLAMLGDAASDEILLKAGVQRARALVTVLPSDADNLFITMSAHLLNEKLYIVTRAEDERGEQKLKRAGASRVVSPYTMGGYRVAHAVLRPTVVDFLDLAIRAEHLELQIEEIQVQAASRLVGLSLKDSNIRQELGIIIVGIKQASGAMVFTPTPEQVMNAGDILIVMGNRNQLTQLERMAAG